MNEQNARWHRLERSRKTLVKSSNIWWFSKGLFSGKENMGIENRAGQIELKNRKNDYMPFIDSEAVKGAARAIMDGMQGFRHRAGEVVYPYYLSPSEIRNVRELVRRQSGGLVRRIGEFIPTRLEEGMGTVISIRKKGGK